MPQDLSAEPLCSHCRFPLPSNGSGLRHYGTHTAHQENECLRLLQAEIARLTAERDALQANAHAAGFVEASRIHGAEIEALRAERDALARWKSTNAPRLEALEGLLHAAQREGYAGREARATLDSERAANAELSTDADRLDFLSQPGVRIVERKNRWAVLRGFTNYEFQTYPTLRAAIDAARKESQE